MHPNADSKRPGCNADKPRNWSSAAMACGIFVLLFAAWALAVAPQAAAPAQQADDPKKAEGQPKDEAAKPEVLHLLGPGELMTREQANAYYEVARMSAGDSERQTAAGLQLAEKYHVLSFEFTNEKMREAYRFGQSPFGQSTVIAKFGSYVDVFVKGRELYLFEMASPYLVAQNGMVRVQEFPYMVGPPFPRPILGEPTKEGGQPIARGGLDGYTGKNVIITIVDTGVDFRNTDFVTYDNALRLPTSRLLYFWDTFSDAYKRGMGSPAPLSYPDGESVGTLYTREQLNEEIRSNGRRIPSPDENSHGTACAALAAGNGNYSQGTYKGVAPDADLIAVRIGDATGAMLNSYLLNAIADWVDAVAKRERKPAVVSLSLSGHFSSHDGTDVAMMQLSERFAPSVVGRALVIAGGNDRAKNFHATLRIGNAAAPGVLEWTAPSDAGQVLQIFVKLPLGTKGLEIHHKSLGDTVVEGKASEYFNPHSLEASARFRVRGLSSQRKLQLWTQRGQVLQATAYLSGTEPGMGFDSPVVSNNEKIGGPGDAANAITVGSYDFNAEFDGRYFWKSRTTPLTLGELSGYSNPGYSRSGAVKPELAAPGEWYYAPYARLTNGEGANRDFLKGLDRLDRNERFVAHNGTSAATPYVAGIIALMMQKKPTITNGEIKRILATPGILTIDEFTNNVPNPDWGYGKLDIGAAHRILAAVH